MGLFLRKSCFRSRVFSFWETSSSVPNIKVTMLFQLLAVSTLLSFILFSGQIEVESHHQ